MTHILVAITSAAVALVNPAPAAAQARTVEGAQTFIDGFLRQANARVAAVYNDASDWDVSLSAKDFPRAESSEIIGGNRCKTRVKSSDTQHSIDWDKAELRVTLTGFEKPMSFDTRIYYDFIRIKAPERADLAIGFPAKADAKRFYEALEFIRKACSPVDATGF